MNIEDDHACRHLREEEQVMSNIFTKYSESLDDISGTSEISKDAKIKKLRQKNKKLKKLIRKMENRNLREEKSLEKKKKENNETKVGQNEEGKFFSMAKATFFKVLPGMLRTATRIVATALCDWAFKRFRKWQTA